MPRHTALVWRLLVPQFKSAPRAAILKALSLRAMALSLLGSTAYHVLILGVPCAEIMGAIGIMALAANVADAQSALKQWAARLFHKRPMFSESRLAASGRRYEILQAFKAICAIRCRSSANACE